MGMFGGGSDASPAETPIAAATSSVQQSYSPADNSKSVAPQCQEYSKLFFGCMERNGNEFGMCQDYMEMMKACQQQYSQ